MQSLRLMLVSVGVAAIFAGAVAQDVPDPNKVGDILRANQEINLLQSLVPLKLTKEQDSKLAGLLKTARDRAVKEQKTQETKEAEGLRKIEKMVKDARAKAEKGEFPDGKYYDEWDKLMKVTAADRVSFRFKTVKDTAADLKAVFTEEQMKKIVELSKAAFKKAGGKIDDKVTDNQMYWYYVENVLMGDSTITLLESLSKK